MESLIVFLEKEIEELQKAPTGTLLNFEHLLGRLFEAGKILERVKRIDKTLKEEG